MFGRLKVRPGTHRSQGASLLSCKIRFGHFDVFRLLLPLFSAILETNHLPPLPPQQCCLKFLLHKVNKDILLLAG